MHEPHRANDTLCMAPLAGRGGLSLRLTDLSPFSVISSGGCRSSPLVILLSIVVGLLSIIVGMILTESITILGQLIAAWFSTRSGWCLGHSIEVSTLLRVG